LRKLFKKLVLDKQNVVIDLTNVPLIDDEFLALCLLLKKNLMKVGKTMRLMNLEKSVAHGF
jgi:anti-anti-sigma regulatory factor